jgi:hypothetical protein
MIKICTVKKNSENCSTPISSFIFILKIKQKSGIPFLPFCTISASLNKICPRKWLRALME